MFSSVPQPVSRIVYVQNGRTLETAGILGSPENVKKDAQNIIDKFYGGGRVTLVKHF